MANENAGTKSSCRARFRKAFTILFRRLFLYHDESRSNGFGHNRSGFFKLKVSSNWTTTFPKKIDPSPINVAVIDKNSSNQDLLNLPFQVREMIYNLVNSEDILALRLTSTALKNDVESFHGITFRLHDGRFDYERILQKIGVQKLIVESFTEKNTNPDSLFPFAHLLKIVEIMGPINANNFEFLLQVANNLRKLVITFQTQDMALDGMGSLKSVPLANLKILEVSSISFGASELPSVALSIQNILRDLQCPNLCTLVFRVSGFIPEKLHLYHKLVKTFLFKNSTNLKNVRIEIKKIMHPFVGMNDADEILDLNDWGSMNNQGPKQLEVLMIHINNNVNLWYPIIDGQTRLRNLNLDITNQSLSRLILVLGKCARCLRTLKVTGLSSFARDGVATVPIDLGVLRNLKRLEILEIQHQNTEARAINPPLVLRTSFLPQSLKSVKFSQLRLKPHQAMYLLLKLPLIESVDLENWADSEATLAGFLAVVTFLIKFDQTPATYIAVTDAKRKMENQENAILKMKNVLQNKAYITQNNSELYSKLIITCSLFN